MSELKTTGMWIDGDKVVERRTQDVTPYLQHCAALRSVGAVGSSEMRHAAKIPMAVVEEYMAKTGVTLHEMQVNPVHFQRIANDPANAGFRIWQGKI